MHSRMKRSLCGPRRVSDSFNCISVIPDLHKKNQPQYYEGSDPNVSYPTEWQLQWQVQVEMGANIIQAFWHVIWEDSKSWIGDSAGFWGAVSTKTCWLNKCTHLVKRNNSRVLVINDTAGIRTTHILSRNNFRSTKCVVQRGLEDGVLRTCPQLDQQLAAAVDGKDIFWNFSPWKSNSTMSLMMAGWWIYGQR